MQSTELGRSAYSAKASSLCKDPEPALLAPELPPPITLTYL